DRFVASFVGDANILAGRLVERRGDVATVSIGEVHLDVPAAPLAQLTAGDAADVFVRPEHLAMAPRGAPGSLPGTVATQVFQGDHVDLYIDVPGVARGPVLLRSPGIIALSSCPVGAEIGLMIGSDDVVAFPPE
ncbi:MAG: TOBE domain-containing protein, partial [Bradyrhizobium sp.]